MISQENRHAAPPETLEGWYALHQIFTVDKAAHGDGRATAPSVWRRSDSSSAEGWTAWARLIGSKADLMAIHLAPTLEALGEIQSSINRAPGLAALKLEHSFLSVTEAGLYHLTAELARETAERGGVVGDEAYAAELARRVAKERENSHVHRRLYPTLPEALPYVCFYPMSKRRAPEQNWYELSLGERSRLMQAHGKTGRRYAGRVLQIITGSIGFETWEWGVTLFGKDPLDFKKLVTDMRFDEVSARYAEFGTFYVGKLVSESELGSAIETV